MRTAFIQRSDAANRWARSTRAAWAGACLAVLAACGGDDGGPGPLTCSVGDQQLALQAYMSDQYFWYSISPNPSPAGYATLDDYFGALLYTGSDPTFPKADVWSNLDSTENFNRFFSDGQTLSYGLMVAGLEVIGHPELPLYARYIEPGSPAAAAALSRGDQILSLNGIPASQLITNNDFSALSASAVGQTLTVSVQNAAGTRQVVLTSAVYDLVPVANTAVVTTVSGRPMGYVLVKDMIGQAEAPLDAAFAQFKAAGIQEVAIDLRYNGGGLVSVARDLGSYPAATATAGQTFSALLFNDKHVASDVTFPFVNPANATGLSRVYVLTGPRTCSASEQVINGLRPFVDVVTVGDTTCGKPVGFEPQDNGCGTVVSAVNFESVNASNEGRYFDGFDATCPVAEDLSQPLGSPAENLLAVALSHADTGACPAVAGLRQQHQMVRTPLRSKAWFEPGERRGMINR